MLYNVEKNSKWIDMIDIGTHETPINVFVFSMIFANIQPSL